MQVIYEDHEYTLDIEEIDVVEARYIKKNTGMGMLDLQEGLMKVDPDALAALYWLMMKQAGKAMNIQNVNFKVVKFGNALIDAVAREQAEAENEADEAPKD